MTDILCVSTTDWDEIWGSRQQIMTRLAANGHRVLFVERQVGPEHLWRDPTLRLRKQTAWQKPSVRQKAENLWLWQPPLLPPGRYFSLAINILGQQRLIARLRPVLESLQFSRPALWMYPPHSGPLIGQFGEILSVYHCIDRFVAGQGGLKRRVMESQERDLISRSDLVFVHAEGLRRLYGHLTRRPIILVPSAADVGHFQSTDLVHPDLMGLPRPLLGLTGTLDARIDLAYLEEVMRLRSDWSLVLIGAARPGRIDLAPLLALPNVYNLGHRSFADLPSLLNGIDVLLIPYVRSELTEYISPIKLYEYLANGAPIVSAPLAEIRSFSNWIYFAEEPAGYIRAIEQALQEDSPERRAAQRRAAWEHTWEARLQILWGAVEAVVQESLHAEA